MNIGNLVQQIGKTTTAFADTALNVAKSNEARERIQACDDPAVTADAMQLIEYMKQDRIPIAGSTRSSKSPSVFTGWSIRKIMENYPEDSPKRDKLAECVGKMNMGEIKYRMGRFWWDAVTTGIAVTIALIIIIIVIIAIATKPSEANMSSESMRPNHPQKTIIKRIATNTPQWMKNVQQQ